MRIYNCHERKMKIAPEKAASSIDGIAGPDDIIWPAGRWAPMILDQGLTPGSQGGHAFIRYSVSEYIPGKRVVFNFNPRGALAGLDGRHYFEVIPRRQDVVLRHVLEGECGFKDWLKLRLVIVPLHDALLEDGLDGAENALTGSNKSSPWSFWVKFLRKRLARKRSQGE